MTESLALNIPPALTTDANGFDFLSLGAMVHRLDPGVVPMRKAKECTIHISGGEYNVAANLADCFGLRTAIATAMVDHPLGDLVRQNIRAMGVRGVRDGVRRAFRESDRRSVISWISEIATGALSLVGIR